jgi:hypothetical protein
MRACEQCTFRPADYESPNVDPKGGPDGSPQTREEGSSLKQLISATLGPRAPSEGGQHWESHEQNGNTCYLSIWIISFASLMQ